MRTVLMSFKPVIYEKIASGEKIYEYRRQYSDEETIVFMYVSTPVKQIKGILRLGKRINICDWEKEYSYDKEAMERLERYKTQYKYGMPIESFQETTGIPLKTLQDTFEKFVVPQSYYYLDNFPELKAYVEKTVKVLSDERRNDFTNALPANICLKYE